jgi:hypothetical protein
VGKLLTQWRSALDQPSFTGHKYHDGFTAADWQKIGREISRAWESLSEGWHELLSRSSGALTRFTRHKGDEPEADSPLARFPS